MSFFDKIGSKIKEGFEEVEDAFEAEKHSHTHLGITPHSIQTFTPYLTTPKAKSAIRFIAIPGTTASTASHHQEPAMTPSGSSTDVAICGRYPWRSKRLEKVSGSWTGG
jgi:hypothetical protein